MPTVYSVARDVHHKALFGKALAQVLGQLLLVSDNEHSHACVPCKLPGSGGAE